MTQKTRKLLLDIIICCEEIIEFTDGKTYSMFKDDRMLQLAIEREFEIIGEALKRLEKIEPQMISKKIPEYKNIIGFINIIAHGYDIIDLEALWDFTQNHVPELLRDAEHF